jgi:hypothetical protein
MAGLRDLIALNAAIERARNLIPANIVDEYERATYGSLAAILALDVLFNNQYLCAGPDLPRLRAQSLAHAKELHDYIRFHTNESYSPAALAAVRTSLSTPPGRLRLARAHRGLIRGRRNVAWLTTSAAVRKHLSPVASAADAVRSILGLSHYNAGIELVLVTTPPDWWSRVHLPTFVDGAGNAAFCLWTHRIDCGLTWDLANNTCGIVEVVSTGHSMDGRCYPRLIGITKNNAPILRIDLILTRSHS